jgi:hypothetical protein
MPERRAIFQRANATAVGRFQGSTPYKEQNPETD